MITMYDTTTPGAVGRLASTSPDAVAGYIDGRYRDVAELERLYPNHRHLSIAVSAADDADCLDIENGDATPSQAPGWVIRQHARGVPRPVLYANLSTMPSVTLRLEQSGIARKSVRLWMAHYNRVVDIPEGFDAHQYTDTFQGRNVDVSVCLEDFFDVPPVVTHPKKRRPMPRPVRRHRPAPIHPKVKGSAVGSAIATGILAILHALGVSPITPAEAAGAAGIGAIIAGWLTPAGGQ